MIHPSSNSGFIAWRFNKDLTMANEDEMWQRRGKARCNDLRLQDGGADLAFLAAFEAIDEAFNH